MTSYFVRALRYAAIGGGVGVGGYQLSTYNKYNVQSINHKQTIDGIHEQLTKNAKDYQGLDKETEIEKVCDQFLPERHDDVGGICASHFISALYVLDYIMMN